jgi:gallate dioxygenase
MTGIATLVLNDEGGKTPEAVMERHRERMAEQLRGSSTLDGTYLFDITASVKAYRINKYLHAMIDPDQRTRFLADPETTFKEADLTEEEKDLIRNRDWQGLIHYGVIFFLLEKLAAVIGTSNLHIYAAMRGESLDDFLRTRNTQVLYSVAGTAAGEKIAR